jgi:hypothetical protein
MPKYKLGGTIVQTAQSAEFYTLLERSAFGLLEAASGFFNCRHRHRNTGNVHGIELKFEHDRRFGTMGEGEANDAARDRSTGRDQHLRAISDWSDEPAFQWIARSRRCSVDPLS